MGPPTISSLVHDSINTVPELFFNNDFVDNNETESSSFSEEAGWSHPQSSRSAWVQACLSAIESVAAYHPLQESSQAKTQQIYDHRTKSWKKTTLFHCCQRNQYLKILLALYLLS